MSTIRTAAAPPDFHGLLYVDRGDRPINLRAGADPLDIYVRCAATCARSVVVTGASFTLVTNDAATLTRRYAALGVRAPAMVEHRFTLAVPAIPFRSAHHKLELYRAFASGAFGPAPVLIDIDTVMLRPLPATLFEPGTLYGYDITQRGAPPYGTAAQAGDLRAIAGVDGIAPRWWGGEFIAGEAAAFGPLADAVDRCWPRYLAAVDRLHHIGDEAVTSAAIGLLARDGRPIVDLGGTIRRWWSNRTTAPQIATMRDTMAAAIAHLPADKPLLARFATPDKNLATFADAYGRHVRARLPAHRLLALVASLRGDPRHHVPRLG